MLISAGTFLMGAPEDEFKREHVMYDAARPRHQVTIARPFWLGKFPMTRGEYAAFAAETGRCNDWTTGGHPQRVVRGGCCLFDGNGVIVTGRDSYLAESRIGIVGFRCIRVLA